MTVSPAIRAGLLAEEDRLRVFAAIALGARTVAEADEERVLRNFLVDGRLVRLPARYDQKRVVLGYVARRFDEGREYAERDVNTLLRELHDDTAALRRYLVDEGLLESSAGVYRRA